MICTGMSEKEKQMMHKLEDLVEKQRDAIRAKDHELTLRNEDVEAVRNQIMLHQTHTHTKIKIIPTSYKSFLLDHIA